MSARVKNDVRVKTTLLMVIIFSVLSFQEVVWADRTVKCGGRLVSLGATQAEVREKCGAPDQVERREEGENTWISQLYDYAEDRYKAPRLIKGPIQIEIWTYNFGANRFVRYLLFENGVLIRIETGEKGHD